MSFTNKAPFFTSSNGYRKLGERALRSLVWGLPWASTASLPRPNPHFIGPHALFQDQTYVPAVPKSLRPPTYTTHRLDRVSSLTGGTTHETTALQKHSLICPMEAGSSHRTYRRQGQGRRVPLTAQSSTNATDRRIHKNAAHFGLVDNPSTRHTKARTK